MVDEANKQESLQWFTRGVRAVKAQELELAQKCLIRARKLDPQNLDVLLWLTRTTDEPEKRKALLELVLALEPDHEQAKRALEVVSGQVSSDTSADRQSVPAVSLEPDSVKPAPVEDTRDQQAESPDLGHCPDCGAVLRLHEQTGAPHCIFCGFGSSEEDHAGQLARRAYPEVVWNDGRRARHCLTCDTFSIVPEDVPGEAALCPLCQQSIFEPVEQGVTVPDAYLPFKVTEAQAAIALEDLDDGGLFRRRKRMSRPRRVFIPMWLFSGKGRLEYTYTGHEDRRGLFTHEYPAVPAHSVPQIDGALLKLASSVNLAEVERFSIEDSRDSFVVRPNVPARIALREAQRLMLNDMRQQARRAKQPATKGGRTAPEFIELSVDIAQIEYMLVLLPVWINDIRGAQIQMGLSSGVSGRAGVGELVKRSRG